MHWLQAWFSLRYFYSLIILWCFYDSLQAVIHSGSLNDKGITKNYKTAEFTIQKVSLTQKGYIQFLKYFNEVPTLTEYTFCIWVRSINLTYSHPLLSYTKHEAKKLISVWISPLGTDINLEILGHPIFKVPVNFLEDRWYHVCQSWASDQGAWNLFLNGKLYSSGVNLELKNVAIEGGGDIVVGQEYTDFDKGLNDGIEGDVSGFNFVLSPTSHSVTSALKKHGYPLRRNDFEENILTVPELAPPLFSYIKTIKPEEKKDGKIGLADEFLNHGEYLKENNGDSNVVSGLTHFDNKLNRHPRGFLDFLDNIFSVLDNESGKIKKVRIVRPRHQIENPSRILNDIQDEQNQKTLGLLLVEFGYYCGYKKGAPLTGKGVLINWAKTPVRVFGGAILKNVPPFCKKNV